MFFVSLPCAAAHNSAGRALIGLSQICQRVLGISTEQMPLMCQPELTPEALRSTFVYNIIPGSFRTKTQNLKEKKRKERRKESRNK